MFDIGENLAIVIIALAPCWAIVRIVEAKYYSEKDDEDAKPE